MNEELLEPMLRRARLGKALPAIRRYPQCRLLDFGCGWEARLLKDVEPYISRGVGIDRRAPAVESDKLTTLRVDLEATLPFEPDTFDVITMLAVLEHLNDPLRVLVEVGSGEHTLDTSLRVFDEKPSHSIPGRLIAEPRVRQHGLEFSAKFVSVDLPCRDVGREPG